MNWKVFTRWLRLPGMLVFSLAVGLMGLVTGVAPSEAQDQPKEIVYGQTDFTSSSADSTASTLHNPVAVAVDSSGNVYVADTFNNRVLEFPSTCATAGCSASRVYGQPDFTTSAFTWYQATSSSLHHPVGVAVDSSGNLYVADSENDRVLEFPTTCPAAGCAATRVFGQPSFTAYEGGWSASSLGNTQGVAVDSSGNVYVADTTRVMEFPSTCPSTGCSATRVFGQSSFTSRDGGTTAATLRSLTGVGLDSSNNIYVADTENRRVLEFPSSCAPTGCSATRVFGQPNFTGGVQGLIFSPSASNFEAPVNVAVDSSGNVYVVDTGDSRVLEFSSSCPSTACSATRVYGQTSFTTRDAGLTASGLYVPRGVAVDSRGAVYVADTNNRVLGSMPVGADTDASAAITSNPPSPASAPAAATPSAPEVAVSSPTDSVGPPSAPESAAVPDTLTESLRADILAAVDRGNAAWSAAQQSLDAGDLQGGLTGQELSADTSQLAQFRSVGQRKNPRNTAFTVLDVSLDSPTEASVHTHETWSDDVYDSNTGALIRHDPPTNYSETYMVELVDGQWTVSQIQLR